MTAVAPRLRPARVTVTLKDGRKATHSRESHRGDFQPLRPAELRGKFRELAGRVLTAQGREEVQAAVYAARNGRAPRPDRPAPPP